MSPSVRAGSTQVELRHLARGAALGLAGSCCAAVAGFGLAVVVTRGLDVADAGRFFAVTSVFALMVTAASFGTESGLARFLLRLEARSGPADLRRAVTWAVVPTALVACAWAAVVVVLGDVVWPGTDAEQGHVLRWVAVALPAAVVADVMLSSTRGVGQLGPTVVVDRLARAWLQVAAPVVVLSCGGGLTAVTFAWAGAYLVSAPLAVATAARSLRRRAASATAAPHGRSPADPAAPVIEDARGLGRQFWSFTWPRGIGALAQMGIQKGDIIVVAVLLTPADAALYAAATRFVPLGQMAVQALQQALQPRLTAILVLDDRRALAEVFRAATTWSILLAWPLYLVVMTVPSSYLSLFGERYDAAATVVVVMGAAMLVAVATGPVDTLLVMAGRSGLSMLNALGTLALDMALCLLLIPHWGITGAAVAWGVAVVSRCSLAIWQVRAELAIVPDASALIAGVLPTVCLVPPLLGTTALLGTTPGTWVLGSVLGLVAYGLALRRWRRDLDLDVLVGAWRRAPVRPPDPTAAPPPIPTSDTLKERETPCRLETPHAR